MDSLANKARRTLISTGKVLPFVICFIIFIGYAESLIALATNDFLEYDGYVTLNTRISFVVAQYFKYDLLIVCVVLILSFAIETCRWNKYAVLYMLIQLGEKYYFDFEMDVWLIYVICIINIVISGFLTHKGIKIALK
jgi:hypothetical protein